MTHVLVVHHDPDMADQESDWLRQAGYEVGECAGPQHGPCPILYDLPCTAVAHADVLVYDIWASGDAATQKELIERLRRQHPDIPIVLTAPGLEFDWGAPDVMAGVVVISGRPGAEALRSAVGQALASVGRA